MEETGGGGAINAQQNNNMLIWYGNNSAPDALGQLNNWHCDVLPAPEINVYYLKQLIAV